MPSTDENSSIASTKTSSDFHQQFRRSINALQEQVESLSSPGLSPSARQSTIDVARVGIASLSSELADVSGGLASYDQRSYMQAIKELQDKLTTVRASHAPKAKFSFKNKRLTAPTSEADSATTSIVGRETQTSALASPSVHVLPTQDNSHHEGEISTYFTDDDSHWILIGAKKDAYLRQPSQDTVGGVAHGKTCIVSDISSSVVDLGTSIQNLAPSALTLNTIETSLVLAPDIKGPAHMTGLRNTVLVLTCHQFRMHKSHNVDVYLQCHNRPIIEDCSNIRFARMPDILQVSGLDTRSERETGVIKQNLFDQVDDFKWLRNEASPNWRVMREEEAVGKEIWQGALEALRRLDGEPSEESAVETVARTLQDLKIKPAR